MTNPMSITAETVEFGLQSLINDYHVAHVALRAYSVITKEEDVYFPGYMNLRDVITHIYGMLKSEVNVIKQYEELVCAREHARRAVTETYQNLFDRSYKECVLAYSEYLRDCAPFEEKADYHAVDHSQITRILDDAKEKARLFRYRKSTSEWQEHTLALKDQIQELTKLSADIDHHRLEMRIVLGKIYDQPIPLIP